MCEIHIFPIECHYLWLITEKLHGHNHNLISHHFTDNVEKKKKDQLRESIRIDSWQHQWGIHLYEIQERYYNCLAKVLWTGQTKNCILSRHEWCLNCLTAHGFHVDSKSWEVRQLVITSYHNAPLPDKLSAEDRSLSLSWIVTVWIAYGALQQIFNGPSFTLFAYLRALSDSSKLETAGLMHVIINVLAFPPSESCNVSNPIIIILQINLIH